MPSKQQSAEQLDQKGIVQGNNNSLSNPPEITPQIQGKSQLSTPILSDKSLHSQPKHFAQPPDQNMGEFFPPLKENSLASQVDQYSLSTKAPILGNTSRGDASKHAMEMRKEQSNVTKGRFPVKSQPQHLPFRTTTAKSPSSTILGTTPANDSIPTIIKQTTADTENLHRAANLHKRLLATRTPDLVEGDAQRSNGSPSPSSEYQPVNVLGTNTQAKMQKERKIVSPHFETQMVDLAYKPPSESERPSTGPGIERSQKLRARFLNKIQRALLPQPKVSASEQREIVEPNPYISPSLLEEPTPSRLWTCWEGKSGTGPEQSQHDNPSPTLPLVPTLPPLGSITDQIQQDAPSSSLTRPKLVSPAERTSVIVEQKPVATVTSPSPSVQSKQVGLAGKPFLPIQQKVVITTPKDTPCAKCGEKLSDQFVLSLGNAFHLECLTCAVK